MTRIAGLVVLILLCIAGAPVGCTPDPKEENNVSGSDDPKISNRNTATLFLTGNTLSTLQPCGCSADQLGGFDRRPAIINSVNPESRAVIDTGNMLKAQTEQDIIKLQIIAQALSMIQYDLVHLDKDELQMATELGLTEGMPFSIISDTPNKDIESFWSKPLKIGNSSITLNVASIKSDSENIDSLLQVFTADQAVNILIVDNCNDDFIDSLAALDIIDVIICPTNADEPRIVDKDRSSPLLISVGRLGKYFARINIELTNQNKPNLHFDKIAVSDKIKQEQDLVDLYKDYQMMVKEEGLLEKHPRTPLPDGLKYLGSENCNSCHDNYEMWEKNKHAHAYQTLVEVGSQYDPECVGCHTVGFGYESGFANEKSKKDLRNVGCEVCHGPGSDHFKAKTTGRTDSGISDVVKKCVDCHTSDRSPAYSGNKEEYMQKIIHWPEQKAKNNVKN